MKIKLIILLIITVISFGTKAQLVVNSGQSANNQEVKEGPGKLLKTLAEAIRANAWLNTYSKQRAPFLNTAENVSNATGMAANISLLATFIKPYKFKTGITKNTIMAAASNVTSMNQAKSLLKDFENWLKPDAINAIWKLQRSGWLNEIELVK